MPATDSSMNVRKTGCAYYCVRMRKVCPGSILPQNPLGSITFRGSRLVTSLTLVQPGPQHPCTAKASQTTRRTCYLPETERSWALIHHKEFSMTTAHFDQLQLAERWGLSPKTLERWRVIGTGPKYIRLPGKVIYRLCDIEAYENECLVSSTAELRNRRSERNINIYNSD